MRQKIIAYVAAEIRVNELGNYACNGNFRGGLGDLGGHIIEGAAKLGVKIIPITYFYPINWQTDKPIDYKDTPAHFLYNLDVDIHFQKRSIPIYSVNRAGTPVFGINDPEAGKLYPGDNKKKLLQSAFLGRAVHALLKKRGERPDIVWCQEWMTACVIPNLKDDQFFKNTKYLFTLHTLVPEALDVFAKDCYKDFALSNKYLPAFSYNKTVDPSLAGVQLADLVTGVSEEFGEFCQAKYPEHAKKIKGIMNGVSLEHVISPHIKTSLANGTTPTPLGLWRAHQKDKLDFSREIKNLTQGNQDYPNGIELDLRKPFIGLARRIADYKNQIIFRDIVRAICAERHEVINGKRGLGANLVIAGLAHENDPKCRGWMEEMKNWMREPSLNGKFVYVPYYSERLRELTTRGCDIHVECPKPGCEACGTSNMLAKINGNPNVATRSGGIRKHGTEFNPTTRVGDTLYIEPYNSATLYLKLFQMCGWYHDFMEKDDEIWPSLRMNNFLGGKELDVTRMMQDYDRLCFEPLYYQEYQNHPE